MQQYARAWALDHSLVERICVVLCAFGIPVRQTLIPNGLSIYLWMYTYVNVCSDRQHTNRGGLLVRACGYVYVC